MPGTPTVSEIPYAEVRNAAREYQDLVNRLDDILFRFDGLGRWSYLSPAWEAQLGWRIANCLARPTAKFVHRSDRGHVLHHWAEVIAGRRESYRGEIRFINVHGEIRWMLVSARGLRDANGRLQGGTGTLTDISAAKAAEAELIAARAAAESANRAKSEFLATMSHELRTPLNAVIGLSDSLLESGAPFDPERTRRYLGIIGNSGRQLLAQINDILDLARIEAGRLAINPESFDARILVTGALESAQRHIRAKRLRAKSESPAEPLIIEADERLLRQALQNLVSNAVKFTPEGGAVTVALERSPEGKISLVVSDTGVGIPADKLDRLFKPFSQVDSSMGRQFGGTGLGLVLVERIAGLHGGSVSVKSAPGTGSVFTLQLPASRCVATRPAAAVARERHVLLVDDDPHQHTLVGDYLKCHDFEVTHCENAACAIAAVEAREPGLAVIDINLPGMNGLELIRHLRDLPHGRNIPIIAATALAEGDQIGRCRAAGADAHLAKPLSLSALAQTLQRLAGTPV